MTFEYTLPDRVPIHNITITHEVIPELPDGDRIADYTVYIDKKRATHGSHTNPDGTIDVFLNPKNSTLPSEANPSSLPVGSKISIEMTNTRTNSRIVGVRSISVGIAELPR